MGNGSDAKEVYQAVLEEIRNELPNIMVQYKESILQTAKQQYTRTTSYSQQEVTNIMNRVVELENKNKRLEGQIGNLNDRISKLEREKEQVNYSFERISANSRKSSSGATGKIDMSRVDIEIGYKFNGWVYYANEEMGYFLYKVRTDGTDNQQLTDYSVDPIGFKVRNGKLYFDDCDYETHSIDI